MGEQQGIVCHYCFSFPQFLHNSISAFYLFGFVFFKWLFFSLHNI